MKTVQQINLFMFEILHVTQIMKSNITISYYNIDMYVCWNCSVECETPAQFSLMIQKLCFMSFMLLYMVESL